MILIFFRLLPDGRKALPRCPRVRGRNWPFLQTWGELFALKHCVLIQQSLNNSVMIIFTCSEPNLIFLFQPVMDPEDRVQSLQTPPSSSTWSWSWFSSLTWSTTEWSTKIFRVWSQLLISACVCPLSWAHFRRWTTLQWIPIACEVYCSFYELVDQLPAFQSFLICTIQSTILFLDVPCTEK